MSPRIDAGVLAQPRLQRSPDRLYTVGGHGLATALLGRSPEPGGDAFTDDGALDVGEDAEHAEHGPPAGCGGVEALLVQVEVHALGANVAEEAYEVWERSSDPIDGPRRHEVYFAPGRCS